MSQRAWNLLAEEFEESVCDITATSGQSLAKLIDRVRPNRRQTLIDAGCGIGTFVERFGERFGRVVAFDFAEEMVERARRRCRALQHVTWQTLRLEDAGQCVGPIAHLVVSLNVITTPDPRLRRQQWTSLAELVRKGGHLLVVVPSVESAQFVAKASGQPHGVPGESAVDLIRRTDSRQKHYQRNQLRQLITRQGLNVLSLRKIHYPWAEDGLEHSGPKTPWDWVCLSKRLE